jgi:glyoxylase-like metal-dependent hydrolase (beta-lactamase superfamily II)
MKIREDDDLIFVSFVLGEGWNTNAYLLADKYRKIAWLVDPGFSPGKVIQFLREKDYRLERILLTHGHLDHIGGLTAVKEAFPSASILSHPREGAYHLDPNINLMSMAGIMFNCPGPDGFVDDGDEIQSGILSCRVIHTPGHSPGGLCFYFEKESVLLSGDTLFQGSVGRYDFPLSDGVELMESIREKLLVLPPETRIFPGHGPDSTLGQEKRDNPFLR